MNTRLVVVLTALNLEYQAVRERLADLRLYRHQAGTRFEIGHLPGGRCRVAVGLVGKGNHPAAVITERAIAEFAPVAVLFVGIAGALRSKIQLGDVVVASQVYAYHGGTSNDDGLKARPRVWEIPHAAGQIAHHLARTAEWSRGLPGDVAPPVHFGPIAAGEVVQDSAISDQAQWVRQHYSDALAIEMEAAGVAQAGHLNGAPVVVIRGISDRADGTKATTDRANWQPRAVAHAAAFAMALAQELVNDDALAQPRTTKKGGPPQMEKVKMVAKDHASVGVMAGQIYGNVAATPAPQRPQNLATGIADLRHLLHKALLVGQLDHATFAAAQAELDIASNHVKSNSAPNKTALIVALKRLRGLVFSLEAPSEKLAAMIATAENLT
jgi:adenosylhomocysteine nucleosidase